MFALDRLLLNRVRFVLRAEEMAQLPPYLGSTLRGALGHALLASPEAHTYCFRTPVSEQSERLRKNESLPHPFLIEPPPLRFHPWQQGDRLEFSIVFVGKAIAFFADFVAAIAKMAGQGLGKERYRFVLERVQYDLGAFTGQPLWMSAFPRPATLSATPANPLLFLPEPPPQAVQILLETPLRIIEQDHLVTQLSFRSFVRSILSRLSSLLYFHCDTKLEVDFANLLQQAQDVETIAYELQPQSLSRWSNRQQRHVPLDGLTGHVAWKGPAVSLFWPLIAVGTLIHAGKSTVFGLGKYSLFPIE